MFETLRAWLNGTCEYFTGVALFQKLSKNEKLISIFRQGKSDYNNRRLHEEMMQIYQDLKSKNGNQPAAAPAAKKEITKRTITKPEEKAAADISPVDTVLYDRLLKEAKKTYKAAMNVRAELFSLAKLEDWENENTPDRISKRAPLAIRVVDLFNKASKQFAMADFAKINGRVPDEALSPAEDDLYKHLPDHLVKSTLTNAQKALSKLKLKEETAERLALITMHENNIKILEKKWHLLRSKK